MGGKNSGFASMNPARVRELARKGVKEAWRRGGPHKWTPPEAEAAREKGLKKRRETGVKP